MKDNNMYIILKLNSNIEKHLLSEQQVLSSPDK